MAVRSSSSTSTKPTQRLSTLSWSKRLHSSQVRMLSAISTGSAATRACSRTFASVVSSRPYSLSTLLRAVAPPPALRPPNLFSQIESVEGRVRPHELAYESTPSQDRRVDLPGGLSTAEGLPGVGVLATVTEDEVEAALAFWVGEEGPDGWRALVGLRSALGKVSRSGGSTS